MRKDKRLQAQERKVQKISRQGIIEENKATGEKTILHEKKDATFQLKQPKVEPEALKYHADKKISPTNTLKKKHTKRQKTSKRRQQKQMKKAVWNAQTVENTQTALSAEIITEQENIQFNNNQPNSTPPVNQIYQNSDRILQTPQDSEVNVSNDTQQPDIGNPVPEPKSIKETPINKAKTEKKLISADRKKTEPVEKTQATDINHPIPSSNKEGISTPGTSIKFQKAKKRLDKTQVKYERAMADLPSHYRLKFEKTFDNQSQELKTKLKFEKQIRPTGEKSTVKRIATGTGSVALHEMGNNIHNKIQKYENDNVAIKAAHKTEQLAEPFVGTAFHKASNRFKDTPYRKVDKLESKLKKADMNYRYQTILQEHPELQKKTLANQLQKRKIKRQYAKKARQSKKTATTIRNAFRSGGTVGKNTVQFVAKHFHLFAVLGVILLLFLMIMSGLSSCSSMLSGGVSVLVSSSYTASDKDINEAEAYYCSLENALIERIANIENEYPGYDGYKKNTGNIGHNPYELMAYLTVKYNDFLFEDIKQDLIERFDEQYRLQTSEVVEIHTDQDGNSYEVRILEVTVATKSFTDIITPFITDKESIDRFNVYLQTKGNRQYFSNPFTVDWIPYVDNINIDNSMDLYIPSGKVVLAGKDGTVIQAGDGTVTIQDKNGYCSAYTGIVDCVVQAGTDIKAGDKLGTTGPKMKLSFSSKGEQLNPYFFVASTGGFSSGIIYPDNPGTPIGDGSLTALITEAEKYLGFPYVWGGSSPSTSFDCSGFVCWVFTQSGVHNLPRTTAQGIFNQCTPVAAEKAKPGDIIFFTGTYSSPNPVTHVGVYLGNGKMIHAGDPISYANINTSYWKQHFYSFGRLN